MEIRHFRTNSRFSIKGFNARMRLLFQSYQNWFSLLNFNETLFFLKRHTSRMINNRMLPMAPEILENVTFSRKSRFQKTPPILLIV